MELDKDINTRPLVSILMCAYNGMPYIKEAIRSVLKQTYSNWELIISDDGSTDGTREYLSSLTDPRLNIVFQPKNLGYVRNKNTIHKLAKGEYITQIDNDDTYDFIKLEKQVAYVLDNPKAMLVGTGYRNIDEMGRAFKNTSTSVLAIIKKPISSYPFWYPSLLVHRSVFDFIGYFDEYFSGVYGDDVYWTVRANEQFEIHVLPDILYSYRYHSSSITNTYLNRRKMLFYHVLSELIRQRIETGTDWLERKNYGAISNFETSLLNNKKILSAEYQIIAAKAIDHKQSIKALEYVIRSLALNLFNVNAYKTLFYLLRRSLIPVR
jgi:glycosyltransferase involved in cell wall biosynthesis